MKHIVELKIIAVTCCCLSACGDNRSIGTGSIGNKDVEIVKKDLREINDYEERAYRQYLERRDAESRKNAVTNFVLAVKGHPTLEFSEKYINTKRGIDKYIDMKRVRNFEVWKSASEKGIPEGQVLLGRCYLNGFGVQKDEAVGAIWICKAAENGLAQAQFEVADLYFKGSTILSDPFEALQWYHKAAEQGHIGAMVKIAACNSIVSIRHVINHRITRIENNGNEEAIKWLSVAQQSGWNPPLVNGRDWKTMSKDDQSNWMSALMLVVDKLWLDGGYKPRLHD